MAPELHQIKNHMIQDSFIILTHTLNTKLDWWVNNWSWIGLPWTPKLFHPCHGWLLFCIDVAGMYSEPSTPACKQQSFSSKSAASSMELASYCIVLRHISTTLAVRTNKHSKLHQNGDTMGPRNQRRCASYHKPTSWTRLMCFSYTAHLRSCTALSTTHPFDASESKGYMAALSTELSAKWHKQKEKRGLNLERWHWKQMERFETVPTPSQGWRSVSITSH